MVSTARRAPAVAAATAPSSTAAAISGPRYPLPGPAPRPGPAPLGGGDILDGLANPAGGLKLSGPVGPGAANDPTDVFRVESVLSSADLLGRPPGGVFGNDTRDAITAAQARLNGDPRIDLPPLKQDGLVNPAGPTEAATRKLAGQVLRSQPTVPKPSVPKPGTAPGPLATPETVVTPSGPRSETLEQTVKRIAAKAPPPALPRETQMTADQTASLERLAGGLRKSTHPGPVAKDIADAFRTDASGTVAEFRVVRDALEKSGTEAQVKNLTDGVRAELGPRDRSRFDQLLAGTDGGERPRIPGPKDDGQNPTFNRFRERLKPREGGFANRPEDRGGPTQKGVSQKLLNKLNKQHPEWGLPKDSKDLKEGQIGGIYRSEFFDKPKIQKVEDIPGIQKQAPQLPEQLFDAGVLHGPKRAGQWLQQSLDERLGTDLRSPDKNGNLVYDGNVGLKTRAAIGQATKNGKIQAVNDAMVDRRADFMRKLPDFKENPGWLPRANSFRIQR